jgi:GntR family galactonate operon transcriptional repressor
MLDRDLVGWLAGEGGLDRDLLLAFEETRAIIEPAAAALAAERADPDDLKRIMGALEAMEKGQSDPERAIAADKEFHLSILEATHNPVLRSFRGAIEAILTAVFDVSVGVFSGNLANHSAVAHAIASGNAAEARQAMERVLGYTLHHLTSGSHTESKTGAEGPDQREEHNDIEENARARGRGRHDKPVRSGRLA